MAEKTVETKRKSISKKIRFEVFKRDKFTCQYCGGKAPSILLEIDHIKPIASGGDNGILNLVTSCFDCNRGKGKRELSDACVIEKQMVEIESMADRVDQLRAIQDWRDELVLSINKDGNRILNIISNNPLHELSEHDRKYHLTEIMSLIKRFGYELIEDATFIALGNSYYTNRLFEKLGGIAYNIQNGGKR